MDSIDLLENGFDYIISSLNNLKKLEDNTGNKYTIKYIIRDLISGIEIILKYRLMCDNWTFVIDNLDNLTLSNYQNGDFVSITLEQAINRLNKLCKVIIKKDEAITLKELKLVRNKIEHFKMSLKINEVISLVYNCLTIIIKFIDNNIDILKFSRNEKKDYNLIKENILNLNNYLNEREKEIYNKHPNNNFEICPKCHKKCVVVKDISCRCLLCENVYFDTSYKRKKYIEKYGPSYREISKGTTEIEEIICPYCDDVMLLDYNNNVARCFLCNTTSSLSDLSTCDRCGKIGPSGICDECLKDIEKM